MQPPLKLRNYKWLSVYSLTLIRVFKRPAKALIRLRVCAGWSEQLLVTQTLLEISCHGSYASSHSLNKYAQLRSGATSLLFVSAFIIFHVLQAVTTPTSMRIACADLSESSLLGYATSTKSSCTDLFVSDHSKQCTLH